MLDEFCVYVLFQMKAPNDSFCCNMWHAALTDLRSGIAFEAKEEEKKHKDVVIHRETTADVQI